MSNRHFNRHSDINAMNIIKINAVDVQSLQASFTTSSYIFWFTTNVHFPIFETYAKLGSYLYSFSHSFDCLADEKFIGVGSILIGGVEKGDAVINGVLDKLDHFGFGLGRAMIG